MIPSLMYSSSHLFTTRRAVSYVTFSLRKSPNIFYRTHKNTKAVFWKMFPLTRHEMTTFWDINVFWCVYLDYLKLRYSNNSEPMIFSSIREHHDITKTLMNIYNMVKMMFITIRLNN